MKKTLLLLAFASSLFAAENDIKFMQENATGGFVEKTLPADATAFRSKLNLGTAATANLGGDNGSVPTYSTAGLGGGEYFIFDGTQGLQARPVANIRSDLSLHTLPAAEATWSVDLLTATEGNLAYEPLGVAASDITDSTATGRAAITAADAAALRNAAGATAGVYPGSTVAAASDSAAGVVELATDSEAAAATSETLAMSPSAAFAQLSALSRWSPDIAGRDAVITAAGGSFASDSNTFRLQTSATANGQAHVKWGGSTAADAFSADDAFAARPAFNVRGSFAFTLIESSQAATNGTLWVGYGYNVNETDASSLNKDVIGIRVDGTALKGYYVSNGTATATDLSFAIPDNRTVRIVCIWDGLGGVEWYRATTSGLTLLGSVTGAPAAGDSFGNAIMFGLDNGGDASDYGFRFANVQLTY